MLGVEDVFLTVVVVVDCVVDSVVDSVVSSVVVDSVVSSVVVTVIVSSVSVISETCEVSETVNSGPSGFSVLSVIVTGTF